MAAVEVSASWPAERARAHLPYHAASHGSSGDDPIDAGGVGPPGPEGPQGDQGIQGVQGVPGNDGAPGTTLHSGLSDVSADQHHAAAHTLTSHSSRAHSELTGIGATDHHSNVNDHAAAHTLASHSARAHADLTGIGADDHHARLHSVIGASDHNGFPGGTTTFLRADGSFAAPPGGGSAYLRVDFMLPLLAASPWTNMPAALSFLLSTATVGKCITRADLTNFTQCRLIVNKQAVAGAAASKLILRYWTAFTQTVATFVDIGASEVSVATNVQNAFLTSAWINLVAGAKADVFLAVLGSGGDGALDPAFGPIVAEFR